VHKQHSKKQISSFLRSKRALAIPVTYLILFVSLITVISATYSFAVAKMSARGAVLRASVAKQNMQLLDDAVHSVAWGFGASEVVYMDDCGGDFQTATAAKRLVINLTDEQTFSDVLFNSSLGKAFYKLEASEFSYNNEFLRGDERTIINQSSFSTTQLYVATEDAKQLVLCYRPLVTAAVIGMSNGKPLNLIRIHVINLNSSQNLMISQKFYLKATARDVATATSQYEFNSSTASLAVKADLDGVTSVVWIPISSNSSGAVVTVEVVVSNVRIQEAEA
jgi:hypothetical protein